MREPAALQRAGIILLVFLGIWFLFMWLTPSPQYPTRTAAITTPVIYSLPTGLDHSNASDQADELSGILATYGKPDSDDSTEYDSPRPPIVTRFIEYRAAQNVRIAFFPVSKYGDPPPYTAWRVIGYIDIATNTKMSSSEAEERLRSRKN